MHEVSLMKNLLGVVEQTVAREGGRTVNKIHVRIGEMSGANMDALRFAFEVLSKGTSSEKAELEFETVPLLIRCRACGLETNVEDFVFLCPGCGGSEIDIISGRELEVDYILIDDEENGG